MGEFFTASPIHTEAASCGVYPTYHTSQPLSVVPVLPARRPAPTSPTRAPVPLVATRSRHCVTTLATPAWMALWPFVLGFQSTRPLGNSTLTIACGGWWMPPLARVA